MRSLLCICAIALVFCGVPTTARAWTAPDPNAADLSTPFNVDGPTKVPGKTLKAGAYSIRVLDHLSDRVLLQIEDSKGKAETRFLGVPNAALFHSSGPGPISYAEAKHKSDSLRGFAFPGGNTVEFVYPKEEAAGIAKANGANVLAIDPASEGRPALGKLSKDDMELITLWTLSPTRIGPENASQAAIQAQRYQPAPQQSTSSQPVQVASLNDAPRMPVTQSTVASQRSVSTLQQTSASRTVRPVKRPSVIASLPHTASELPLIFLSGLMLLGSAFGLRILRAQFGAH